MSPTPDRGELYTGPLHPTGSGGGAACWVCHGRLNQPHASHLSGPETGVGVARAAMRTEERGLRSRCVPRMLFGQGLLKRPVGMPAHVYVQREGMRVISYTIWPSGNLMKGKTTRQDAGSGTGAFGCTEWETRNANHPVQLDRLGRGFFLFFLHSSPYVFCHFQIR